MLTSLWKTNNHPELNRDIVYPGSLIYVYSNLISCVPLLD